MFQQTPGRGEVGAAAGRAQNRNGGVEDLAPFLIQRISLKILAPVMTGVRRRRPGRGAAAAVLAQDLTGENRSGKTHGYLLGRGGPSFGAWCAVAILPPVADTE